MQFRNYEDMAQLTRAMHRPLGITAIAGVPYSGIAPAAMLSRKWHLPMAVCGSCPLDWNPKGTVLVVDDSIYGGQAIDRARSLMTNSYPRIDFQFLGIFCSPEQSTRWAHLEVVPSPRLFEWNFLTHPLVEQAAWDLDGVICEENPAEDDAAAYQLHLEYAKPLYLPTRKLRAVITNRLERYRAETTQWLRAHGVAYAHLRMRQETTMEARRKAGGYALFKAEQALKLGCTWFAESDPLQAIPISTQLSCLCVSDMTLLGG